ncbi:histidine phosphatase family protein [Peribacillus alkalitolerans]|uniref:histidine phosphatase family protein n=1 Tax=Peribacillus alkalitolerans TaxID=1550385 RepID=UPI0013D402E1|nr:histidine phosphatase family protein [Peribacillus alkalitolerans]
MDDIVAITFLRHGLTESNAKNAYLGWTDEVLSEQGRRELCGYSHINPTFIFTSDLKRCKETASILFPSQSISTVQGLREMHFGDWEGLTHDELQADKHYQKWLDNYDKMSTPNGESFQQFQQRVETGWEQIRNRIISEKIKETVVIAHGGSLRYILSLLDKEKKSFWDFPLSHGTGYTIQLTLQDLGEGKRCILSPVERLMENGSGPSKNSN